MSRYNVILYLVLLFIGGILIVYFLPNTTNDNFEKKGLDVIPQEQSIVSNDIKLEIISTQNGIISGKTSPYAEVFINDQETKADENGNFSLKIQLDEGDNIIVVTANDSNGNVAEETININYEQQN